MSSTGSRSFKALMVAQSLDALNVNLFKLLVAFFLMSEVFSKNTELSVTITQVTFVLPYILVSLYAGYLSDRFSKTKVIRYAKLFELGVIVLAALCLSAGWHLALVPVLFLMSLHSAVLSPAKYGIMPELLDEKEISRGNGYLEFWTLASVLAGTALSGALKELSAGNAAIISSVLIGIAVLGFVSTLFIRETPRANEHVPWVSDPIGGVVRLIGEIRQDRPLFLSFIGVSYFWMIGLVFQSNILLFAKNALGLDDFSSGLLAAVLGLGIGVGSIAAGRVSEGKVELGLVPLGALGMALFSAALYFTPGSFLLTCLALAALGVSAGFFIVPLNSFFQQFSPKAIRGRYIAANNFVTYCAMLVGTGVFFVATKKLHLSPGALFLLTGVLNLAVGIYIVKTIPGILIRCLNWIISHSLYRLRVSGLENVPATGGALLVANHVSYVDPSLILASLERSVRFLMYKPIYEAKLIHPVARAMRAIPISAESGPKAMMAALLEARQAVLDGELVCIFAEGGLSRIGHLLPFNKGLERIMKGLQAPIIPVYLDQLWGSIFSYRDGRFFFKWPKEIPYPVTVTFGEPLPAEATAAQVRQTIQELSVTLFTKRQRRHQFLHLGFLAQVRRTPFKRCLADSTGREVRYIEAAIAAIALGKHLTKITENTSMVGVMLPPSIEAVVVNLALLFLGKTPVNLNFTTSRDAIRSAIKQCGMSTVVTSERFIEKLGMSELPQMTFLEDLHDELPTKERIQYAAAALLLPASLFERWCQKSPSDVATVIFSSGSTGEPKGVVLSHGNICSNLESLCEVFPLKHDDVFLGVLPMFHSFGFTASVFLPLLSGNKVVFHPNPMDGEVIGRLAAEHRVTVLMSTPTFLQTYLRRCSPEQFSHLRFVIVGAEKLKERLATAFAERFGITPLEGYGATELSPVAIMNVPDFSSRAIKQLGTKLGSVGHPIPGVAVRIVDPDTLLPLPIGEQGLLLVKGPNVMKGYLNDPEKTRQVIRDGWYVTGDLAVIDELGFVTITDRLSRFSKIGGEMVPHGRIEDEIHQALGATERVCVVTAVPDEKKGEKLVVLHRAEIETERVLQKLSEQGLPNLWIPKRENFFAVAEFPILGSGKLDLKGVKELAKERTAEKQGGTNATKGNTEEGVH